MTALKRNAVRWGVALLALTVAAAGFDYYRAIYATAVTEKPFHFELPPGWDFTRASDELDRAGLIPDRFYWQAYAVLRMADRRIKAGMYRIEAGTTAHELLDDLIAGNTIRYSFTIYEGWTLREILAAMHEHPQLLMQSTDAEKIREYLGIAELSPEGWIYPDTYLFEKGTSNLKLLKQAHEIMKKTLSRHWEERMPELPFKTPYEALILASIVEKETAVEAEYARIASVFISRLQRGMALQADPTVIYGLGEAFDGDLRKRDLKRDTPYNSYTRTGLPPTPIAMPSEISIAAVLKAEITGDLYFVSKGDGSHHFSKTYEEHRAMVRRYQLGEKP